MSSKQEATDRGIANDESEDLVGVAGLGVLGATRDDDDRERTAERLEGAQIGDRRTVQSQPAARPTKGGLSRRGALATLTGLGAIGLGAGTASAGPTLEYGQSFSGNPSNGYALKLLNDNTNSNIEYGLRAEADTDQGRGVHGEATSTSGENFGVFGKTESTSNNAAGVFGIAGSGSGRTYGFKGRSNSPDGRGALGRASADTGSTIGVEGVADSDSGTGVWGRVDSLDGSPTGVHGLVYNASDGIAVHGEHQAGGLALKAEGDADVTGVLTVGKLGAEAYLASDQSISNGSDTKVTFDTTGIDDRGEFGSSEFQAKHDGTYLVTTQVTWKGSSIGGNVPTRVQIVHDDGTASVVARTSSVTPSSDNYSLEVSKTIRDVSATESIYVEVWQDSSGSWKLLGNEADTWIEVSQIA